MTPQVVVSALNYGTVCNLTALSPYNLLSFTRIYMFTHGGLLQQCLYVGACLIAVSLTSDKEWYTIDLLQHLASERECSRGALQPIAAQDQTNTAYFLKGEQNQHSVLDIHGIIEKGLTTVYFCG